MRTLAREAAVLAVTCELRGMAGVGKVMLVGGGDGGEFVSVSDSSLLMLSNWATSSTASSSSLGVPVTKGPPFLSFTSLQVLIRHVILTM